MNKVHLTSSVAAALTMAAGLAPMKSALAAGAKTFKGPVAMMHWGPVQAGITVKSGKITAARISVSPHSFRSQFIDDQAVPILRQETLQAQSANIDLVSGATLTSEAYVQSLQRAISSAKQHKALK